MVAAFRGKERVARLPSAVLAALLLLLAAAWIWLIQGGSYPSAVVVPAHPALCNDAAAAGPAIGGIKRGGVRHIYVVGCGHSGTSLLKRTIGNLPGIRCRPKETWLYEHLGPKPSKLKQRLTMWDLQAAERNFTGWVEKTPRHINYLARIFELDPVARVVLIVRDGRDVAASLRERGSPWEDCRGRWIKDNTAALPFLDHPQLLVVRFEDFFSPARVLGVLRQVSVFAGVPAPPERMLLSLQPPTAVLTDDEQCVAYDSEVQKLEDLSASYLQQLEVGAAVGGGGAAPTKGREPQPRDHKRRRSWQSSQPWAPQRSIWEERLSEAEKRDVEQDAEFQGLLRRFGYG